MQQGQAKDIGEEKNLKRHQHENQWEKITFFSDLGMNLKFSPSS